MTEKPLNEYIDLDAYDVVTGETHRATLEALSRAERERDELADRLTLRRGFHADDRETWEARAQKAEEELAIERGAAEIALPTIRAQLQKAEAVVEAARNFDARFEERFINGMAKPLNDAIAAYDAPPTEQIPGAGQDGC